MADNKPNADLARHTRSARLGHVDAFVSHSWHDDPKTKWTVLQKWRAEYKHEHGREPLLWIDKYSIDQKNIEGSLSCLPVYLAGCTKLLVLCGHTYLQRLWCIVEIFVFLEMGGNLDNLEVRLLDGDYGEGKQSLSSKLKSFDVRSACCFEEVDTIRLHDVIEYTGYAKIEKLVRDVFVGKL